MSSTVDMHMHAVQGGIDAGSTWDKMEEMFKRDSLNFRGIG